MSTEIITIKQVPPELKSFWAEQARQHDRSMNKELIRLLELERQRRLGERSAQKDRRAIDAIIKAMRDLPVIDARPVNEMLYDDEGMPK